MERAKWTVEEYNVLFDYFSTEGTGVSARLSNRAPTNLANRAQALGQHDPAPLTKTERVFINEHGKTLGKATAFFISGHSPLEISGLISSAS